MHRTVHVQCMYGACIIVYVENFIQCMVCLFRTLYGASCLQLQCWMSQYNIDSSIVGLESVHMFPTHSFFGGIDGINDIIIIGLDGILRVALFYFFLFS